jgi:hypothetical protein
LRMMHGGSGMALGVPDQEDFCLHPAVTRSSRAIQHDRRRSFSVSPHPTGEIGGPAGSAPHCGRQHDARLERSDIGPLLCVNADDFSDGSRAPVSSSHHSPGIAFPTHCRTK